MKKTMLAVIITALTVNPVLASTSNSNGPTTTNNYYDQSTTNQGGSGGQGGQGGQGGNASALGVGIGLGIADASAWAAGGTGVGIGGNAVIEKGAVDNNVTVAPKITTTQGQKQGQMQCQDQAQDQQQQQSMNNKIQNGQQQTADASNKGVSQSVTFKAAKNRPVPVTASAQNLRNPDTHITNEAAMLSTVAQERRSLSMPIIGKPVVSKGAVFGVRVVATGWGDLKALEGGKDNTCTLTTSDAVPASGVIGTVKAFPSGSCKDVSPETIDAAVFWIIARDFHGVEICRVNSLCRDYIESHAKGRGAMVSNASTMVNHASDGVFGLIGGLTGESGRSGEDVASVHTYVLIKR